MRQRPAACLALFLFLILSFLPAKVLYEPLQVEESCEVQVLGQVSWQIQKEGRTQIYLRTCQVRNEKVSFEEEKLLVYLAEPAEYAVGTDLSLSGIIYPIEEPTNPGQFDSKLYYQGKGIAYTVYAEYVQVQGVHPAPIRNGLLHIRKKIGQVYEQVLGTGDCELLKAMVLGEKEGLDADIKTLYQKSGISHLLAISGLHVSLVGLGVYRFWRRRTGSYAGAGIPSILFLCAYGWMTGASVSTVRAVAMCMLMILADLIGRTYDMLTAVGVAALLLMCTNPLSVRQSGFLLSFGAVLAIALIQPLWTLYRPQMGKTGQSLSVSLSVLIVTFPLLLRSFGEYSLYSTILNLIAIPLMTILMVCGILCGLGGCVWIPIARLLAVPCQLILALYEWMGKVCLKLPKAVLFLGSPSGWKVCLYYAALAAVLAVLYREKRRKKYWRKQVPFAASRGRLCGCIALMFTMVCVLCLRVHTGLSVTMLDVGQGDAVFFRSPSGTTFLYDGGSSSEKKVGEYCLLPFLRSEGTLRIDYILISHMDEDHTSGLLELIKESREDWGIQIGHAVLPDLLMKDEAYQEMEAMLAEAKIPILYMVQGDRLAEEGFSLTCLWPERGAVLSDRNELSLTLLLDYGEFQMLFTGDIGSAAESQLVSSGVLKDIEVLKVAHHGSRYSSSQAFLNILRPEVSLISCSATNRYGHPGEETLKRLLGAGSRVYITKDCGAIRVWTDGEVVKVSKYRNP